jgi:hypothetical protein
MRPTPKAERLAGEVSRILRTIGRVLAQEGAFDPATTDRAFTLAGPDFVAATLPAQSPPWAAVYRAQPSITEDRAAIAGRAAVGAALSCLAVVGCCNPLGWLSLFASLRAYANTGDADLGPAADRADRALRLAWWAFGSTTALWVVGIAAWWFTPA